MEIEDCVKLLYESELGGEPPAELLEHSYSLAREMYRPETVGIAAKQPEWLGDFVCRVHLGSSARQLSNVTARKLCDLSWETSPRSRMALDEKLAFFIRMAQEGKVPYEADAVAAFVAEYRAQGCPNPVHSARFIQLYKPDYLLLRPDIALFLPVFAAVDQGMAARHHLLVGIDGMSAAGKSSLAALLEAVYACGVVHADDFFLRPEQRSRARLAQPGGNIDYERLKPAACLARDGRAFSYQAYDCHAQKMDGIREVPEGQLTLLEGVYALHPSIEAACDLRVFLSVNAGLQRERLFSRGGKELANRYEIEWIPLENRYFSTFAIRESCDIIIDTSVLK